MSPLVQTEFPDIVDEPTTCGYHADHGPVRCICGRPRHEPSADCREFVATYNAPQAVHLTGATYRQWDYWTKTGRIQPCIKAHGSGTVRRYLAAELDTVRLALALQRLGFGIDPSFAIARQLVVEDEYRAVLADVFELSIRVRDTNPPTPEEAPQS